MIVTHTDGREEGGGEQCHERCQSHGSEKWPVDKGKAVNLRVEHHRPREDEKHRDREECTGQVAPFMAYREPALDVIMSALVQVVAREEKAYHHQPRDQQL
jgi:hypothetical protein